MEETIDLLVLRADGNTKMPLVAHSRRQSAHVSVLCVPVHLASPVPSRSNRTLVVAGPSPAPLARTDLTLSPHPSLERRRTLADAPRNIDAVRAYPRPRISRRPACTPATPTAAIPIAPLQLRNGGAPLRFGQGRRRRFLNRGDLETEPFFN